jgi:exosortase C (VPDSG-CTERM-specific)
MDSLTRSSTAIINSDSSGDRAGLRRFFAACVILTACFGLPLFHVVRYALNSDLYSFIILVPLISGYLVWVDRQELLPAGKPVHRGWAAVLLAIAVALLAAAISLRLTRNHPATVDALALTIYAFVFFLAAAACYFLGRRSLRIFGFPIAFLIFLSPFPVAVETGLETLLQHGSSWMAHRLFDLSSMPVYRETTFFQLPGFSMQVAPECSGIRSTLALFLTSLVAGQLFLRSPWKRIVLAAIVLPLALVRNGFRVFVIGELCVNVGPHMINSWIHRHGGPAFFALSLIPFSVILYLLHRSGRSPIPAGKSIP